MKIIHPLGARHAALLSGLFLSTLGPQLSTCFAQGSLTPPGPPGPTMKSLDQVQPRTAISSLPFTISAPGSYYLTGNLQFTAASGDAITVSASDVSIDLMGFALSSATAVTGNAIRLNSSSGRVAVRNGSIVGNTTVSVSGAPPNQTWKVT